MQSHEHRPGGEQDAWPSHSHPTCLTHGASLLNSYMLGSPRYQMASQKSNLHLEVLCSGSPLRSSSSWLELPHWSLGTQPKADNLKPISHRT